MIFSPCLFQDLLVEFVKRLEEGSLGLLLGVHFFFDVVLLYLEILRRHNMRDEGGLSFISGLVVFIFFVKGRPVVGGDENGAI